MKLAEILAFVIKAKRQRLGWTQRELADRVGMQQSRIAELESGQGNPTLDTVEGVLSALWKY
jgi:predicted transcriptional regulator